jgi:DNA-binding beta-propeller fold protein YncE
VRVISAPADRIDGPSSTVLDAGHLYVVNYTGNTVTELDAGTGKLVRVISG